MGSEGNYGIVTEAIIKVKPLPEVRIFESVLFYEWEDGVKFMHAVSKMKLYPTSCRLVDNEQFKFGATMKPAEDSTWHKVVESLKKFYVVNVKGYNADNLVACTMLFEGPKDEMSSRHKAVVELAKQFRGMAAGPENGMRGYLLTFMIAYTRDLALQYAVAAESFETSCPWVNVSSLCSRVKQRIFDEAGKLGFVKERVWISFRVTQLYETGAAVYVYFTLYHKGFDNDKVVHYYEIVEDAARDEVLASGGCISHHHGVGKIRKGFMERTLPPMAIDWQKNIKDAIDPNNVFAINNTVYRSEAERNAIRKQF